MSCDHTRISSSSFSTCLSCKRRAQDIVNEQRERIAELEKVAEAAAAYVFSYDNTDDYGNLDELYLTLEDALQAAGYGGGE